MRTQKNHNYSLDTRIKDLDLDSLLIEKYGSEISQLYAELAKRGLIFRPRVFISDDWFSPDDAPVIAIPFYLLTAKLKNLAKKNMVEVEGTTKRDFMKLLRHECGHAIETAFNLKYSRIRQKNFGFFSKRYPASYLPDLSSDAYVSYLGFGYAQAHPCEDFAETFALWLEKGSCAKKTLKRMSGAYRKLEAMEQMMENISGQIPKKISKSKSYCYKEIDVRIGQFFYKRRKQLRVDQKLDVIKNLRLKNTAKTHRIFPDSRLKEEKAYKIFTGEIIRLGSVDPMEVDEDSLLKGYYSFKRENLHRYVM